MERVHELRDLVHDHLGPRGDLHDFRAGVERRRAARDLDRLAGDLRLRAAGGGLDVGADLGVPDGGRPLLVGGAPGRRRLELVHGLVQHRRPDRHRGIGRLRRGALPRHGARALQRRHLRRQLRRRRPHPQRDVPAVPDHPRVHLDREHLLLAPARPLQQHLCRLARAGRRGDHRAAGVRSRQPPGRRVRIRREDQQHGVRSGSSAASPSGSS